jgi:hypothetical protein
MLNDGSRNLNQIAHEVNISRTTLDIYAKKFNIVIKKSPNLEYEKACDFVKENYTKYSAQELADKINKKLEATRRILSRLGLKERKRHKKWSKEELDELLRLKENNYTIEQIAEKLGVVPTAVEWKLYYTLHLNNKHKRFNDSHRSEIRKLFDEGKTDKEIADILGFSIRRIRGESKRLGVYFHKTNWSDLEILKLKECLKNDIDFVEIVKTFGRSRPSVARKIYEIGGASDKIKDQIIFLKIRYKREHFTLDGMINRKLYGAKKRSLQTCIDFNITIDDIKNLLRVQNNKCFYTGREFINETNNPQSFSIDRIDSSKGYTKDNINLVCWYINCMKLDLSHDEFIKTCSEIAKNHNVALSPST